MKENPIETLRREITCLSNQLAEHEQSFQLQWDASRRAVKMWQEAHPGNENTWPDTAKLELWLMERRDVINADARRLDWLEKKGLSTYPHLIAENESGVNRWADRDGKLIWTARRVSSNLPNLRAAIDAAMEYEAEHGNG